MAPKKKAAKEKPAPFRRELPAHVDHIIGLDLSVNATGIATFDTLSGQVAWSTIRNNAEQVPSIAERIRLTLIAVQTFLDARSGKILVGIENLSFAGTSAIELGMLQGVIRNELLKRNIPVVLVQPNQIKKFVTGKSQAEKDLIIKYIEKRFGHDCDENNAADALGIVEILRGLLALNQAELLVPQREVLESVMTSKSAI